MQRGLGTGHHWMSAVGAGASCLLVTPLKPPEGLGSRTLGPTSVQLTRPPLRCTVPQAPRTGSSCSSNTTTSSRGCGWGQPGGQHHDWTLRGAGPPPLALCARGRWGTSATAGSTGPPTSPTAHCRQLPPGCWRASQLLVVHPVPRGQRRTWFPASCGVGMGGCRLPGLRGAGSGTLTTAWGFEKRGRGAQRT